MVRVRANRAAFPSDDAVLVVIDDRFELYARNLPALARAADNPDLLHEFDDDGVVPIGPVMLRDDGVGVSRLRRRSWEQIRGELLRGRS